MGHERVKTAPVDVRTPTMTGVGSPDSRTPSFPCSKERREPWCVVRLSGEIDMASTARIWPLIQDLVADQGLLDIEVDLGGTTFVDSTGICLLLQTESLLADIDGRLRVSDAPPFLRHLLDIVGLDDHFEQVEGQNGPPAGPSLDRTTASGAMGTGSRLLPSG
jgi:anti-anti-sigma factor